MEKKREPRYIPKDYENKDQKSILLEVAEKIKGKELFPKKVARAKKKLLGGYGLSLHKITVTSSSSPVRAKMRF